MKKFFYLFLALTTFTLGACSDSNEEMPRDLAWAPGTETNETIYADETQSEKGFTFTAVAPWKAFVEDITRAACDWITLSKDSGEAGTFTIQIDVKPNDTGADRKAQVIIECNDTRITLTVEQKGITKDEAEQGGGEVDPTPDPQNNRIVKMEGYDYEFFDNKKNENYESLVFTYDADGRVTNLHSTQTSKTNDVVTSTIISEYTYTYFRDKIKINIEEKEGESKKNHSFVFMLDDKDRIVEIFQNFNGEQDSEPTIITYDAQGQLLQMKEKSQSYHFFTNYIWDKGNIVKQSDDDNDFNTTFWRYDYDKEIPNSSNFDLGKAICDAGNAGSPYMFPLGSYMGKRLKNLPTAEVYVKDNIQTDEKYIITYEHDAQGRISKISEKINANTHFHYDITYAE